MDTNSQLPPLTKSAMARIKSADAAAEAKLGRQLLEFFMLCKASGEIYLGRNPKSGDLLDFFRSYAEAAFDARARERLQERLPGSTGIDEHDVQAYRRALGEILEEVIETIVSDKGVWWRTVMRACRYVDLGAWRTRYGTYDRSAFLSARAIWMRGKQLRSALWLRARHWEEEIWLSVAAHTAPAEHTHEPPAPKTLEDFVQIVAQLLDKPMTEKGTKRLCKELRVSDTVLYTLRQHRPRCGKARLIQIAERLGCPERLIYRGN
jgi:hypothetical protein